MTHICRSSTLFLISSLGPPGLAHDSPRAQTCTFQGTCASNTTKIPREDTQRDTETAKRWREREEKARNFEPTHRAPPFGPNPFVAPLFLGWPPHPIRARPFGAPPFRGPTFSRLPPPPSPPPPHQGSTLRGSLLGKTLNWPPKSVWPKSVKVSQKH